MIQSSSVGGVREPLRVRHGAKALIRSGDAVLLVKERHADGSAFWTLPGGGVEAGESPVECLRRELREELDCRVLVGDRMDSVLYAHHSTDGALTRYSVHECSLASRPTPRPEEGTLECRWARPEAFPASTLPQFRLLSG